MTKEDLVERIGTIASSGTLDLLKKIQEEGKSFDGNMIGQFGIGFYSAYMLTDEITIETRHADSNSKAYRWVSGGSGTYTIEECDREKRGTKISFIFKEEHKEFSETYRIKEIVKKYSNFIDFPIFVGA